MTESGRACAVHGLMECPGYKMIEGSAREKLYKRHQELRKKSGLPDPEYYQELKASYNLPDEERLARVKEIKKKYNVKGVAEGRFDEPLTGWHIVSRAHGQVVRGTPSFETKDQAQKYLMTQMFANHQDFKVVHTAGVAEGVEDRVFYAVQDPDKSYHIYSITGNITDLDEFQGKFGRKLWIEGPLDEVDRAHRAVNKHKQKQGVAEGRKPDYNFDIEDIKKLEQVRDLETLKTLALQLISKPSAKPMKPEKVEWFKSALERMDSPLKVIKLMYDLLLSGEGHSVIGSRKSMNPNTYRQRFGEEQVTNEDVEKYLEEMQRAGYEVLHEQSHSCPECGGTAFSDQLLAEKKDACYSKVKSRYKVWPSAYASGALVRCRKVGAKNWGNKSKK